VVRLIEAVEKFGVGPYVEFEGVIAVLPRFSGTDRNSRPDSR
jgi:hypothetical protein